MALPHHLIITGSGFDAGEFFYGCNADVTDGPPGSGSRGLAPGEDGLSTNFNRAAFALAENDEYLYGKVTRDIAGPEVAAVNTFTGGTIIIDPSGGATGQINYTGTLYMGESGWPGAGFVAQERLDQIFSILDSDYNEVVVNGNEVKVTGVAGSSLGAGFVSVAVTLTLNETLPSGDYRIGYYVGTTVEDLPAYALTFAGLRGLEELPGEDRPADRVTYAGGSTWHDGTTNPATDVEAQLDKIITDLVNNAGTDRIGAAAKTDGLITLSAGSGQDQLQALADAIGESRQQIAVNALLNGQDIIHGETGTLRGMVHGTGGAPTGYQWVSTLGADVVWSDDLYTTAGWLNNTLTTGALWDIIYSTVISKYVTVGDLGGTGADIQTAVDPTASFTIETSGLGGTHVLYSIAEDTNSNYLIAVGNDGTNPSVVRSANGSTWVAPTTPPAAGLRLSRVVVNAAGVALAVGHNGSLGVIVRSTDGGDTWATVYTAATATKFTDVVFDSVNGVWLACGYDIGTQGLHKSTDASGSSWIQVVAPASYWTALSMATNGNGLVAAFGDDASLRWSTDGGTTWGAEHGPSYVGSNDERAHYIAGRFIYVISNQFYVAQRTAGILSGLDI
jgi:hypothetical protein